MKEHFLNYMSHFNILWIFIGMVVFAVLSSLCHKIKKDIKRMRFEEAGGLFLTKCLSHYAAPRDQVVIETIIECIKKKEFLEFKTWYAERYSRSFDSDLKINFSAYESKKIYTHYGQKDNQKIYV